MDAIPPDAYIAAAMNGLFLTLLALLTGLVTPGATTQAHDCMGGEAEVGVLEIAVADALALAPAIVAAGKSENASAGSREPAIDRPAYSAPHALAVLTGIDRARE